MIGWVKLHRKLRQSWMWRRKNKNAFTVFVCLLMVVEYEPKEKPDRGYTLEVGETDMTISQIAEECGLSVKQARAALDLLAKKGALKRAQLRAQGRAQDGVRTTLLNWASYQSQEKVGTGLGTETGTKQGNSLRSKEDKKRTRGRARDGATPRRAYQEPVEEYSFSDQDKANIKTWASLPLETREQAMTNFWGGDEGWRSCIESEQLVSAQFSQHFAHEKKTTIGKLVASVSLRQVS